MNYTLLGIFAVIYLIGIITTVYQVYKFTMIDAQARGFSHPRIMALLATSGQKGEGLFAYWFIRKKYPIQDISNSKRSEMNQRKRKAVVGTVFMICGVIGFLAVLTNIL